MATQIYLRSLRTRSAIFAILLLSALKYHAQNGVSFYLGTGGNVPFSRYANAVELDNKAKGKLSTSFNFETKLKFSKHFSVSLNYLWTKNHLQVRFDEIQVSYFHRQSQTGGYLGSLTYVDDLYLYGNNIGLSLNYNVAFSKNKLLFSLGLNRAFFNSSMNRIDRDYGIVPANTSYANIDKHQTSSLEGPKFWAPNAKIRYERLIRKNSIGLFAEVSFMYNIIDYSFEFEHSSLGWEDRYNYAYGNGGTSVNRYYTLSYHSLNCTLGVFFNINFKKNESH